MIGFWSSHSVTRPNVEQAAGRAPKVHGVGAVRDAERRTRPAGSNRSRKVQPTRIAELPELMLEAPCR